MAWRIDEFLVRGEIDNRARGRVTGSLWFTGRAEAVELDLAGNAWRDVAGRRLIFVNPQPKPGILEGLRGRQSGVVGDITASRKVRVPEIPLEQIGEYYAARKPFPWHWGNSLYLEWFSVANGRVVIESAAYELSVVGETAWEMNVDEERIQQQANGEAMARFMERLGKAVAEEAAGELEALEEADRKHPLAERASELSVRLHEDVDDHSWVPNEASSEHPVAELVTTVMQAAAKLAGSLNVRDYPPPARFCGHTIARLKRAAGYLNDAQLAVDACQEQELTDSAWLAEVRREIATLKAETDRLIGELRERLERGWD
jgi:hypothetical protein